MPVCRWKPAVLGALRGAVAAPLLLGSALPGFSQAAGNSRRDLPAVRFAAPPVIDGDLSDPCWQQAAKADRFTDELLGTPCADQTIAYLGYDDKNIYVAFHAFDRQPAAIVARQTKRGVFPDGDDIVALTIDPFHTHNDRSTFIVNPLGTQVAFLSGGRASKLEWEGKWQAAAKITADGWTAEMAVPWAILNYPALKHPTTCGLNFDRRQQRTKIHSWWSNLGPQEFSERDGHWVGIQFPHFRPQLSLLPYVSPGWMEKGGGGVRSGLDIRSRLTPTLTLVGTVNPDFQNIEEAVESIDFSYSERFIPDHRPFFQEGQDTRDVNGLNERYFYSRRIDAFDTGINLYGKVDPRDTVGVITALNPGRRADWVLDEFHNFGPTSLAGLLLLNRDDTSGSNRVFLLGGQARKGLWRLASIWSNSWVNERATGSNGEAFFSYQSPRWNALLAPFYLRPGYRDDLGYIPFTDYEGLASNLSYSREWRKGGVRSFNIGWNTNDSQHFNGSLFRQERTASFNLQSRSDVSLDLGWDGGRFEQFDDSVFSVGLKARASDPFHNYGLGYSWGRRAAAPYRFVTPFTTWRFGRKLTLGIASSLLFHSQDQQQHIVTFNYDFSPKQGIAGRLVAQTGGTNGYFSYRHSGYGGTETFLILGDPNATKFQKRVAFKVVWAR